MAAGKKIKQKFFIAAVLVAALVYSAQVAGINKVASRSGVFEYKVAIHGIPSDKKELELWIPIPSDNARQEIGKVEISGPADFKMHREREYGNRYAYTKIKNPKNKKMEFTVSIPFTREAVGPNSRRDTKRGNTHRFLKSDKLVPLDGAVSYETKKIPAGEAELPRRIYDYVIDTMRYDKKGDGWGQGDLDRACDVRTGNCTDFHSMFIGLARINQIPARFVMGVPLPAGKNGSIKGYHCWAEYYEDKTGWHPVDASEAYKNPSKKEMLYKGLDADRLEFSRGRDVQLKPAPAQGPLNYFFYPVAEIDGQELYNVQLKLEVKASKKGESG
jgi:transglutaminase-like putative cysteine protease